MWEWLAGLKRLPKVLGKMRDLDRYEASLEARERALKAEEENSALRGRIAHLEAAIKLREVLTVRDNAYWKGAEGPFCTHCFDAEEKLIRLAIYPDSPNYADCPHCKLHVQFRPDVGRGRGQVLSEYDPFE